MGRVGQRKVELNKLGPNPRSWLVQHNLVVVELCVNFGVELYCVEVLMFFFFNGAATTEIYTC